MDLPERSQPSGPSRTERHVSSPSDLPVGGRSRQDSSSAVGLLETIRQTVDRHGLFALGLRVVVAVSGGPDSVALLHALHALQDHWPIILHGAHLDHGFRGEESAADADYVRDLCRRLDIPCTIGYEDVPALKKRLHLSSQAAARRARHAFLRRVADEIGSDRIALGHTRDDRVETILLNILRGSGTTGLQGFPPVRLPLVRPLYEVSRSETVDYCARHALSPRTDSSNSLLHYRRNRLRHELIPYLVEHFNPRVAEALLRLSDIASAESDLLDRLAEQAMAPVADSAGEHRLAFDLGRFNGLQPAMRRRVLRLAISQVHGRLQGVEHAAIEAALTAAERGESLGLTIPAGEPSPEGTSRGADGPGDESGSAAVRITVGRAGMQVARADAAGDAAPWIVRLPEAGSADLPDGGSIKTRVFDSAKEARAEAALVRASGSTVSVRGMLLFRMSDLGLPLAARSWRPGDRMRPRGLDGEKKLQDIFVDRKVPRDRRRMVPVIVDSLASSAATERIERETNRGEGRIIGLIGIQGSELDILTATRTADEENSGACLLIMALSHSSVT